MGCTRVLVVEDDSAMNDIVCKQLSRMGLEAEPAFSGTEARRLIDAERFDLVITDLMLPGMTGAELVETIRSVDESVPIIVVSARTAPADKVDLLSVGADDYLSKPFDLAELEARILVQLRHVQRRAHQGNGSSSDALIETGKWVIDPAERSLVVAGEPIALTRTEYDLAEILARNPKRVFTKQELYELVWDEGYPGQENSISTHVSNLRAKLKPSGTDSYIQTVWGLGFKLDAQ